MTAWHLPFALSGQNADLPNGSLTFKPKLTEPAWALPFFLPGVMGTIRRATDGQLTLNVKIGSLVLEHLSVDGVAHQGTVSLVAGEHVTWK